MDPGAGKVAAVHQTGYRRCGAGAQICYPPAAWEPWPSCSPQALADTLHVADGYSRSLVWDEVRRTVLH